MVGGWGAACANPLLCRSPSGNRHNRPRNTTPRACTVQPLPRTGRNCPPGTGLRISGMHRTDSPCEHWLALNCGEEMQQSLVPITYRFQTQKWGSSGRNTTTSAADAAGPELQWQTRFRTYWKLFHDGNLFISWLGFPGGSVVKTLPAKAGALSLIPGGKSWRRKGNPFQYSCWEIP